MALGLLINLIASTAQFDSALDKSQKRIKEFARGANQAGQAASKIGSALRVADVAGLQALAASSKVASAAIGGLTAAVSLLGAVPLPLAIGAAAIAGMVALASSSNAAEKSLEKLHERYDALVGSKAQTELSKLTALQKDLDAAIRESVNKASQLKAQPGAEYGKFTKQLSELRAEAERLGKEWNTTTLAIAALKGEGFDKAVAGLTEYNTGLQRNLQTQDKGAEATARFELENGKLAEALREAGDEGKRLADAILANARAIDVRTAATERANKVEADRKQYIQDIDAIIADDARLETEHIARKKELAEAIGGYLNPALSAYRAKLTQIDEAVSKSAISEADAIAARLKAAEDYRKDLQKTSDSPYWDQAKRNIQGITASLIKGETAGRNFGQALLTALRDIAAEKAAAQLIDSITNGLSAAGGGGFSSFFSSLMGKSTPSPVSGALPSGKTTSGIPSAGHGKHGGLTVVYSPTINAQGAMSPDMVIAAVREGEARVVGNVQQMLAMRARGVPA